MKKRAVLTLTVLFSIKSYAGYHHHGEDDNVELFWLKGDELWPIALILGIIIVVILIASKTEDSVSGNKNGKVGGSTYLIGCLTPLALILAMVCWQIIVPIVAIYFMWTHWKKS